jgi:hypothetical protein
VAGVSPANLQRYHGYHFVIAVLRAKRQNPTHMNPRNTIIAIFATLSASLALSEDFKTINGKEYKHATVSHIEADGIVLKTKSGISKVYFVELPKEVQQRFGYDAQKAATYSAEQNWAREQRRKQQEIPLATAFDPSISSTKWAYSQHDDEMGRGTTKLAQVVSSNTVRFGSPYEGETHAALQLRKESQVWAGCHA